MKHGSTPQLSLLGRAGHRHGSTQLKSVYSESPGQSSNYTRLHLKAPPADLVPSPASLETSPQARTYKRLLDWVLCFIFFPLLFAPRAFKINELKAEVANHLAVLEKRVECEWSVVVVVVVFPFFLCCLFFLTSVGISHLEQ